MTKGYSEIPENWAAIAPYVNQGNMIQSVLSAKKCFFYDTCSFRYHANMQEDALDKLLQYILRQNGIIIITRGILMELASHSHILQECYVGYLERIYNSGIEVYIIYEEELQNIMDICFASRQLVNDYLVWAVRMVRHPISSIEIALRENVELQKIVDGKNRNPKDFYPRFFRKVRSKKEENDNLGEELLAICLHILSNLPEPDGKFCVITDDKGAAGKIDASFRKTNHGYRGKRVILFSTPKLAQELYKEGIMTGAEELLLLLRAGNNGTIKILGTEIYDINTQEITLKCEEAAAKIVDKSIHIVL